MDLSSPLPWEALGRGFDCSSPHSLPVVTDMFAPQGLLLATLDSRRRRNSLRPRALEGEVEDGLVFHLDLEPG